MKTWLCFALLGVGTVAHATVHDLKADWSEISNPNGVWTLREGNNALPHVASWQAIAGGWSSAQPGWADSQDGNNRLPFFFKSNGTETFAHDRVAGDVLVHSWDGTNGVGNGQANILWTSTINGVASINGSVWLGRDIGRAVDWKIFKNGGLLTGGSLSSGDVFNRANPFALTSGSGGAGALTNISIATGDQLVLQFDTVSGAGDFVGMNYVIEANPVPEPVSLAVLGLGSVLVLRKRRRLQS